MPGTREETDMSEYTIDPNSNWRLYTNTIPQGGTVIGAIHRGIGDVGALVHFEATGLYVQVNAGASRSLDQRAVSTALKAKDGA